MEQRDVFGITRAFADLFAKPDSGTDLHGCHRIAELVTVPL
jgi:hypothetical protein